MEIGSLAEWVTGLSELLAVCVALFLPFISEKQRRKRTTKKLVTITHNMAIRVLQEKEKSSEKKVENLDSYEKFKQFVSIVSLINEDLPTLDKINKFQDLLLSVNKDNSNLPSIYKMLEN